MSKNVIHQLFSLFRIPAKESPTEEPQIEEAVDTGLRGLRKDTCNRMAKLAQDALGKSNKALLKKTESRIKRSLGDSFYRFKSEFLEIIRDKEEAIFPWKKPLAIPPNTKFVNFYNGNTVIIIEEKPRVRLVRFEEEFCEDEYDDSYPSSDWSDPQHGINNKKYHFHLSFPYMIYLLEFKKGKSYPVMRVFYRTRPWEKEDDSLYLCHLPNIAKDNNNGFESDNVVCAANGYHGSKDLAEACHLAILDFWSSDFNNDYKQNWNGMHRNLGNIWKQEKKAEKEPNFVLDTDWETCSYTISSLLKNICQEWSEARIYEKQEEYANALNNLHNGVEKVISDSIGITLNSSLTEEETIDVLHASIEQFARSLFHSAQEDFSNTKRHYSKQTIRQFTNALQLSIFRTVRDFRLH